MIEAESAMVDSNLQRENVHLREKAKASPSIKVMLVRLAFSAFAFPITSMIHVMSEQTILPACEAIARPQV